MKHTNINGVVSVKRWEPGELAGDAAKVAIEIYMDDACWVCLELHEWSCLLDWLLENDEVLKAKAQAKNPRRLSVSEQRDKYGIGKGNRTDNRIEIDSHKRFEEDLG